MHYYNVTIRMMYHGMPAYQENKSIDTIHRMLVQSWANIAGMHIKSIVQLPRGPYNCLASQVTYFTVSY